MSFSHKYTILIRCHSTISFSDTNQCLIVNYSDLARFCVPRWSYILRIIILLSTHNANDENLSWNQVQIAKILAGLHPSSSVMLHVQASHNQDMHVFTISVSGIFTNKPQSPLIKKQLVAGFKSLHYQILLGSLSSSRTGGILSAAIAATPCEWTLDCSLPGEAQLYNSCQWKKKHSASHLDWLFRDHYQPHVADTLLIR